MNCPLRIESANRGAFVVQVSALKCWLLLLAVGDWQQLLLAFALLGSNVDHHTPPRVKIFGTDLAQRSVLPFLFDYDVANFLENYTGHNGKIVWLSRLKHTSTSGLKKWCIAPSDPAMIFAVLLLRRMPLNNASLTHLASRSPTLKVRAWPWPQISLSEADIRRFSERSVISKLCTLSCCCA